MLATKKLRKIEATTGIVAKRILISSKKVLHFNAAET